MRRSKPRRGAAVRRHNLAKDVHVSRGGQAAARLSPARPEEVLLSERAARGADKDVLRARTELEPRFGSGPGSLLERQENQVASVVNFVEGSSQILVTRTSHPGGMRAVATK
jgi:hypothetical protein